MTAWERRRWATDTPGAWPRRRAGLLVRLAVDGLTGTGDAAPMPGYQADDLAAAEAAIADAFADRRWVDAAADADLDRLADLASETASASPSAACALETAALDLIGRRAGVPVARLVADFLGTTDLRRVPVNTVLGPGDEDASARFTAAWERGIRAVKLKVGRTDVATEARLARSLRTTFGQDLELRLDANGAWPRDQACSMLSAFVESAPVFCEQPVGPGDLMTLEEPPVPYAADESMGYADERDALLAAPPAALAAVVLKPMALGGALACARLAARAHAGGIPTVVTHLLDGPVGLAIAAELAAALPGKAIACGIAAHPGLDAWGVPVPQLGASDAGSGGRPGLGLAIDRVPA